MACREETLRLDAASQGALNCSVGHSSLVVRVSAAVTIRQCAEGLSVRVGADHFLVRHHPGSGVIHLGTEEQTVKHADTD